MTIYRIRVSLCHINPPIWRQIEIVADTKLGKLHRILQIAMGWSDSHLHAFRIGDVTYSAPHPENASDMLSERNVRFSQVVREDRELIYEYDFGDGWEHEIVVEKTFSADPLVHYPRCIAGARACPPEDCGGPPGYEDLLAALRDPTHERHEELSEWVSPDFNSEAFALDEVNKKLWRLR